MKIEIEATMTGSSRVAGQPVRQISVSAVLRGKAQDGPPRKAEIPSEERKEANEPEKAP